MDSVSYANTPETPHESRAVLVSGGLDSAILLAECVRRSETVYPLYVRSGLTWEPIEFSYLQRYLETIRCAVLQSLQVRDLPVADLYGRPWPRPGREGAASGPPDGSVRPR